MDSTIATKESVFFVRTPHGGIDKTETTHSLIVVMEDPSKTFYVVRCDPRTKFSVPFLHLKLDPHTFS